MELADQQVSDNEVAAADISAVEPEVAAPARQSEQPEKLSLREQLVKNVETVRTEEAKRARDAASGKFTKLEAGAVEKPATDKPIQPEKTDAQPDLASKPFAPPPGFSTETKAFLATLPPDHPIKRDIEKREGEVSNGIKTYSDKAKQYDAIDQVFAPVRPTYQQAGITSDAEAIKVLLGWEAGFRNPATRNQSFQNLARRYGFDISTLVPSSQSGSPSAAQDGSQYRPDYRAEISTIVQEQVANHTTSQTIAAFAKDHPHFDKVRHIMGALMSAGNAADLEAAYQQALEVHPEVSVVVKAERAEREATDRAKAEAEAKAAAAEKARKAAAAAISPSTRPSGGGDGGPKKGGTGVRGSILNAVSALREERRA